LLRLTDIITEVQRQTSGLRRQAKKAAQYKTLQSRIRSLDIRLALQRHDRLLEEIAKTDALLVELRDADLAHCARIKRLDAELEGIKLKRGQKNQEIADQKNRRFESQREIDRIENDLAHLRQEVARLGRETGELESARRGLTGRNETLTAEIGHEERAAAAAEAEIETVQATVGRAQADAEGTKQQLAELNRELEAAKAALMKGVAEEARAKNICQNAANNRESLQRRLKRLDEEELAAVRSLAETEKAEGAIGGQLAAIREEMAQIDRQAGATEDQLKHQSQSLGAQVKAVLTLENEKGQLRSRHAALKKMEDEYEGYRDGVRAIMTGVAASDGQPPAQVLGLVADILEAEAAYQAAVEAVLGDTLQHILVSRPEDAAALASLLREKNAGRSGFIPLAGIRSSAPTDPPTGERLLDHVTSRPGFEALCSALLGHVDVAPSLPEAMARWNAGGRRRTLVTPAAEMVTAEGFLIGGSRDKGAGILAKKREIRDLESRLAALEARLDEARGRQKALEQAVHDLETGLQRHRMAQKQAAQEEVALEKAHYRAAEAVAQARRRLEIARLEQEQVTGETGEIDAQLAGCRQALGRIQAEVRDTQQTVAQKSREIDTLSTRMETFSQGVLDLKLRQTALQAGLENNRATLKRLRTFRDDGLKQLTQLAEEIDEKGRKRLAAEEKIGQHEKRVMALSDALRQLETSLETNEASYRSMDVSLKETDQAIAAIQTEREAALQKLRLLEVDRSQRALQREALENRILETYQRPLEDFRRSPAGLPPEENAPDERPAAEVEAELADCRKRLAAFADVNLAAISEFEALEKRHAFLTAQQEDLEQALEDLQKVIRKINRITQERFITTFNRINEKLAEVFPRLFEGGTAQLVLTAPEKPLETGVELMIHPPGKKLTQLSLLSGGEKALSAIAFIFAIFLIKPASFCLLDEIDAPLDEANVYRFNNLLKIIGDQSQIIMITHNKKSMEFADTLFGVTMEKKGVSKLVSVNLTHPSEVLAAPN
jgi:chromosome segregation protein